ncbi:NlpC/P60 family protein [Listeria costaricensis]|uniref:NlpC/P60 family protein n=1 Tax=Listeria costaricensis TaxID=2026604 RepID=UPI000C07F0B7|nr:NlpC/P60 family protein [Listeria costaricensis]
MKKWSLGVALLIAALFFVFLPKQAEAAVQGKNTWGFSTYERNLNGTTAYTNQPNTTYTIHGHGGGKGYTWSNKQRYLPGQFVTPLKNGQPTRVETNGKVAIYELVNPNETNITANTAMRKIGELQGSITVRGESNGWFSTDYYGDTKRMVFFKASDLKGDKYWFVNAANTPAKDDYNALYSEAKKHLGKKYTYGAVGPQTFDCSGYTQYVFKNGIGKTIPRTAREQYNAAQKISSSQAKAGDLVFFNYGSGIAHVGIYVGNGTMINCQNNGVKLDNIASGYWKNYLVGYGRVANF